MINKMNACFKIGFIFLMVCVGVLAAALLLNHLNGSRFWNPFA